MKKSIFGDSFKQGAGWALGGLVITVSVAAASGAVVGIGKLIFGGSKKEEEEAAA